MAVREVVTEGHPVLRKSSRTVRAMTDDMRALVDDMIETLHVSRGVGLAANQVGVDYRVIVVAGLAEDESDQAYINPRITWRSPDEEYGEEGCLSFPNLWGTVSRHSAIRVTAQDIDMKKSSFLVKGYKARIFQHEIDHLNGIAFVDRAERSSLHTYIPQHDIDDEQQTDQVCETVPPAPENTVREVDQGGEK